MEPIKLQQSKTITINGNTFSMYTDTQGEEIITLTETNENFLESHGFEVVLNTTTDPISLIKLEKSSSNVNCFACGKHPYYATTIKILESNSQTLFYPMSKRCCQDCYHDLLSIAEQFTTSNITANLL